MYNSGKIFYRIIQKYGKIVKMKFKNAWRRENYEKMIHIM